MPAKILSAVTRLAIRGSVPEFLRASGFDPGILDDPTGRVPQDVALEIWEKASRALDTPHLGIHAARALPLGACGVQEYVMRNSATLGDGLRELCRSRRLLSDTHELTLEVEGPVARLVRQPRETIPTREPIELLLGRIVVLAEMVTTARLPVHEVAFGHDAPKDTLAHRRLFGAPVRFGQSTSEILFDAAALKRTIPGADPELGALLRAHAEQLLAQLPTPPDDFLARVRFRVAASLSRGVPAVDVIARRLRTSTRSLQRRLLREGTSYQDQIDVVRRDIALRRVGDVRLSLGALALDLGFGDASAFYRAFRRWTGTTPGEYRRRGETKVG